MSRKDQLSHDELREGDLLAYLDGAAPPPLAAHIEACPRCLAELADLRAAELLLAAAVARADCPAPELLLRHQAGLLAPAEGRAVAIHAAACAECSAELALFASPPEPALPGRLARVGMRIVRALLQPAPAPALALRGAGEARRAVFAAEGYQILVAITPMPDGTARRQIEGQILVSGDGVSGLASLGGGPAGGLTAPIDELGFFAFDGVPPGVYALSITLDDAQVLAEPLEVV